MGERFSSGTTPMPFDPIRVIEEKMLIRLNAISGGGGGGSGSVLQGTDDPIAAPSTPTSPAVYTNLTSGVMFTWNVTAQAWQ